MKYDISLITNYILDYDPGISKVFLSGSIFLMCGIAVGLKTFMAERLLLVRCSSIVLTGFYVLLMFYLVVLCRSSSPERIIKWKPFWSYFSLFNYAIAEHIMNVLMFIPFGFLAGSALAKGGLWKVCLAGSVVSLAIEVTQFITKRGICNIDDVIHNTLGCVIGFAGFVLCYKMARRIA